MRPLLALALSSCTSQFSAQYLAEQSAALSQTPAVWRGAPPAAGEVRRLDDITPQALDEETLTSWEIIPHDDEKDPKTQRLIKEVQRLAIGLDGQEPKEEAFLFELHSGELFLSLFTQTPDQTWAWVDSLRLPALALKEQCRDSKDGATMRPAALLRRTPDALWLEVRTSDLCSDNLISERMLSLISLQQGELVVVFSSLIGRSQQLPNQKPAGEQIKLTYKADPNKRTLLLTGTRRMFPLAGGDLIQESLVQEWYYFDGERFQPQK